ncbi:MAG: sulfotransferase family protein, partial [Chloroflexota bacterium]|nr:sulfotransferase family protein [Chloroflexota bacterium]
MYSFAQRDDTSVFDEPLYAHYLSKTPARAYHPGAEEVIATMENDG